MPPATGGSTSGSVISARSSERPRNSSRASTHAIGTPSTIAITVAALAVSSDNRSAVRTSGLLTNEGSWCQGVRISKPGDRQDQEQDADRRGHEQRVRHPRARVGARETHPQRS